MTHLRIELSSLVFLARLSFPFEFSSALRVAHSLRTKRFIEDYVTGIRNAPFVTPSFGTARFRWRGSMLRRRISAKMKTNERLMMMILRILTMIVLRILMKVSMTGAAFFFLFKASSQEFVNFAGVVLMKHLSGGPSVRRLSPALQEDEQVPLGYFFVVTVWSFVNVSHHSKLFQP